MIEEGDSVPDVLIRNIPADDLAVLDARARHLGLSRGAFLHRLLHQEAQRVSHRVTAVSLADLAGRLGDIDDDDVMTKAWS